MKEQEYKPMTTGDLVDELIYANYAFNRAQFPQKTVAQWHLVFGEATPSFEQRYQAEQN